MVRKEAHALTFEQARALLAALESPIRELVMFAILTSMNVAEILGLQSFLSRFDPATCKPLPEPEPLLFSVAQESGQRIKFNRGYGSRMTTGITSRRVVQAPTS